jgi:hypothetical protein
MMLAFERKRHIMLSTIRLFSPHSFARIDFSKTT